MPQFNLRKTIGPLALAALLPFPLSAQSEDENFTLFPFPVIYYTPETDFVFGAAANATFRFAPEKENNRPSRITTGAAYSLNNQLLTYAQYQLFANKNQYYFFGEIGYYRYTYLFYGTGENQVPEELYKVNFPRIKLNATYLAWPNLYAGIAYQFEDYNITDVAQNGALAGNEATGTTGSLTSALGPVLVLDTRDQVFYPRHGYYGEFSTVISQGFLGSSHNFSRIVFDLAFYQALGKRVVFAFNSFNSFVNGNAPFQQQSLLGGNKRMRGYYEGRYIDENLMVLQTEARFEIYKRFGAVAFVSAGALGNEQQFVRINQTRFSYGVGLRFKIDKEDHLNLRLDYARGRNTSGFYFTVGEAF